MCSAAQKVLQSNISQKAVEMGFDPIKVERTILQKLRQNAEGYTSVEALIQDLDASITPEKAGKCLFSFFVHFQSLICMQGTFK